MNYVNVVYFTYECRKFTVFKITFCSIKLKNGNTTQFTLQFQHREKKRNHL